MANLVTDLLGKSGVENMIAEKVGDAVADMVSGALGGDKKDEKEGGAGGLGNILSMVGGDQEKEGGFNVKDALSLVNKEDKKDDENGGGVSKLLGLLH